MSDVYLALSGSVLDLLMLLSSMAEHNDTVGAFDDKVTLIGQ